MDRFRVEKIVGDLVRTYGLSVKRDHLERVIFELVHMDLPEEMLRSVALSYLAIGESYFFRDRGTWEALPLVLGEKVKMLSVGCSEGEEVYTFSFVAEGRSLEATGMDACFERIERARIGVYDEWKLREMKKWEVERFFKRVEGGFSVKGEYRRGVDFIVGNVANGMFGYGYDFIFARRVLIYLEEKLVEKVLKDIKSRIGRKGFLILGKGEVYWQMMDEFEPVPVGRAVFWKVRRERLPEDIESRMMEVAVGRVETLGKIGILKDLVNKGYYETALDWARSMKLSDPRNPEIWKYEVVSLAYLGMEDEAQKILEEALRLFPEDKDLLRLERVIG